MGESPTDGRRGTYFPSTAPTGVLVGSLQAQPRHQVSIQEVPGIKDRHWNSTLLGLSTPSTYWLCDVRQVAQPLRALGSSCIKWGHRPLACCEGYKRMSLNPGLGFVHEECS